MVERKVDLVITGELRDGATPENARRELARLFRRSAYEIDYVFSTLPFTIRRDLPLAELPRYLNMFREAGVVVKVVPAGQTYVADSTPTPPVPGTEPRSVSAPSGAPRAAPSAAPVPALAPVASPGPAAVPIPVAVAEHPSAPDEALSGHPAVQPLQAPHSEPSPGLAEAVRESERNVVEPVMTQRDVERDVERDVGAAAPAALQAVEPAAASLAQPEGSDTDLPTGAPAVPAVPAPAFSAASAAPAPVVAAASSLQPADSLERGSSESADTGSIEGERTIEVEPDPVGHAQPAAEVQSSASASETPASAQPAVHAEPPVEAPMAATGFEASSLGAAFGFGKASAREQAVAPVIPFPVNLPTRPAAANRSSVVADVARPTIVREAAVREIPRPEPSPVETISGLKIEALRPTPLVEGGGLEAMGPPPSAADLAAAIAVDVEFESMVETAPEPAPVAVPEGLTRLRPKVDPFALPKLEEAPPLEPPAPVAPVPVAVPVPVGSVAATPEVSAAPVPLAETGMRPGEPTEEIVCPKCGTRQPRRTLCSNCGIDMRRASVAAVQAARLGPVEEELPEPPTTDALIDFLPTVFSLSIDGRIGRMRFLAWSLPGALMWTVLQFVGNLIAHAGWLPLVMLVFGLGFIASLLLTLRFSALRLHDFGYGGAWTFVWLVPGLNLLLLGLLAVTPGEKGINHFGAAPPPNTPLVYSAAGLFILVVILDVCAAVGLFG